METKSGRSKNVAGRVREAVQPLIEQAGYTLWDVLFYKEVSEYILEVSIDRDGGISTDDCAAVTRLIDPLIDELDPVEESYCLEVSSAGTVRELRSEQHYAYAMANACPVTLRTFAAVDDSGQKQWEGTLTGFDAGTITLQTNTGDKRFDKKQIAKLSAWCENAISEQSEE